VENWWGATKNEVDMSATTVMGLLTHRKNEYVIYLFLKNENNKHQIRDEVFNVFILNKIIQKPRRYIKRKTLYSK